MLLALFTAAALLGADPAAPKENGAQVEHLEPSQDEAPTSPAVVGPSSAANDERAASLVPREPTRRKSVGLISAGAELISGALGGYLALVVGIAANVPRGGLSSPPDGYDVLYLGVLPAVGCAALAWLAGLLDFPQRTLFGSAIWSLLGSAVGEAVGVGAGALLGRAMYPHDSGAAGVVAVFCGPAGAVLGALLFMELFKPGEEVYATLELDRARNGSLAMGPAVLLRF